MLASLWIVTIHILINSELCCKGNVFDVGVVTQAFARSKEWETALSLSHER